MSTTPELTSDERARLLADRDNDGADHRPDAYWEGDTLILRASSLGRCIGEVCRTGYGITPALPPEDMVLRWIEGSFFEDAVLQEAQIQGWEIVEEQPELELVVLPGKIIVRCHPDAIVVCTDPGAGNLHYLGQRRVLEAKFLADVEMELAAYDWQMSVEMAVTRLPGLWARGQKVRSQVGEQEVVTMGDVGLSMVDRAPYSVTDIKRRAMSIYKAVTTGEMPECDQRQYPCGHWREEGVACAPGQGKVKRDRLLGEDVREPLAEWHKGRALKARGEAMMDKAKTRLVELAEQEEGDAFAVGEGGVELTRKPGNRRFNRKKAEAVVGSLDAYYDPGKPYWELREGKGDDERSDERGGK